MRGWYRLVKAAGGNTGAELAGYPFGTASAHYRRSTLTTTVYPVTAVGAMDPANERGRELLTAMAVRSFSAVLDLDGDEFPL